MASSDGAIEFYDSPTLPIDAIVKDKAAQLDANARDDAFFVIDLSTLYGKLEEWNTNLPTVQPFYALKCNNDTVVARFFADAGVNFDCASKAEIQQILNLGVHPSRIIFANPCKPISHVRFAYEHGVDLMTFDDLQELLKIKQHFPTARLILRIKPRAEFKAKHSFNKKYGCDPSECESILLQAKLISMNIVGISFHIGSLPEKESYLATAISDASNVFQMGEDLGFHMSILDIGGGFPGTNTDLMDFENVAKGINEALQHHFPASRGVRVIAEPGRYFVTTCCTLAVQVIAKKIGHIDRQDLKIRHIMAEDETMLYMYYVNDGVYGSFNNVYLDHAVVWPRFLKDNQDEPKKLSIIWGPTCDGQDCILKECLLPELDVGQWMYFRDMGAYTITMSCDFNGITRPLRFYVCDLLTWDKVSQNGSRFDARQPASAKSNTATKGCDCMAGSDLDARGKISQQQITEPVRSMV